MCTISVNLSLLQLQVTERAYLEPTLPTGKSLDAYMLVYVREIIKEYVYVQIWHR